jgi:hypothetical protein
MKLEWVVLAGVLLAGCAVVPAPYPYASVPEPSVSVGVGVGVPVYRRGYYGRPYYYDRWGRPHYRSPYRHYGW